MQTIDASTLMTDIWSLWTGQELSELFTADFFNVRTWLSRRLHEAWINHFWPELMEVEERFFRPDWDGAATYSATAEVFYPPQQKYYQSLRSGNVNHLPTDPAYWAESFTAYSAPDWSATASYVVGSQVYYAPTNKVYQCHTANTNQVPTNASYWGQLTPFNRYVAYEQTGKLPLGSVFEVLDVDPRLYANARSLPFTRSSLGIQVLENRPSVFLIFRHQPPKLIGYNFDLSRAYSAGEQVYFTTSAGVGNFYDCAANTAAGESPESAAAKWTLVALPRFFHGYLTHATLADAYKSDGLEDKAKDQEQEALMHLSNQVLVLAGQEQQTQQTRIYTR